MLAHTNTQTRASITSRSMSQNKMEGDKKQERGWCETEEGRGGNREHKEQERRKKFQKKENLM